MSLFERRFYPAVEPEERDQHAPDAWWFAFRRGELLVAAEDAPASGVIPRVPALDQFHLIARRTNFLGRLADAPVYAAELADEDEPPPGLSFLGLRSLYGLVDDEVFALAGRAAQIVEWDRTHQFCGRCGSPSEYAPGERAKRCTNCGLLSFPRLSPAVITLVEDGERALLARNGRFVPGMYALLAGFVEPGETLEEAVAREITEEVGVDVDEIRYFGSQPWPFPHSIMIGFTARYAGGDVVVDGDEITDARWFTPWDLPERVPQRLSIARRLIDAWAAKHGAVIEQP